MNDILLWLQLHLALGGTVAAGGLLKAFPSAETLFSVSPEMRVKAGEISPAGGEKLKTALSLVQEAREIAAQCRNYGWTVITPESPFYPTGFRFLPDPPLALFAAGDPGVLASADLASVVGTRTPSDAAMRAAYDLASALSVCGVVTVSGGAMGIDSAAHEGALTGRGGTVAVLGCGVGNGYLPERVFLRRRIQKNGVLVSELPPFLGPTRNTFPRRNRLIAALGRSVTVIESGETGGSMITAAYAQKLKKMLFVLSPEVCASRGCEKLAAEGACTVASTGPVTSFYGFTGAEDLPLLSGGKPPAVLTPESLTLEEYARLNGVASDEAKPLFDELLSHGPRTVPKGPPEKKRRAVRVPAMEKAAPAAPLPQDYRHRIAAAQGLADDEKSVFLALGDSPENLDAVTDRTGLSATAVMTALSMLELRGLAVLLPGNKAKAIVKD